jgi:hypothetical protein
VLPLPHDVQVGIRDGAPQGSRAHAGPGENRTAPAVAMLEPCRHLLVDVAWFCFDQEPAVRGQQLGAPVQQPRGQARPARPRPPVP